MLDEAKAVKRKKLEDDKEVEEGFLARTIKKEIDKNVDTIVDNLMVNIGKVTVVIELDDWKRAVDGTSDPNCAPASRVRLEMSNVSLYTCDREEGTGKWRKKFMDEAALLARGGAVSRECKISAFNIRMCDRAPDSQIHANLHMSERMNEEKVLEYYGGRVLADTNFTVRLIRRKGSEDSDVTEPKLMGQLQAAAIRLRLSRFHHVTLSSVSLAEPWKPDELRTLLPRPNARPARNAAVSTAGISTAREWWRFAGNAVMHRVSVSRRQAGLPVSWKYFCGLVLANRPYIAAWKSHLRAQGLSGAEQRDMDMWEETLYCDDILYLRKLAGAERAAEDEKATSATAGPNTSSTELSASSMKDKLWRGGRFLKKKAEEAKEMAEAKGYLETGSQVTTTDCADEHEPQFVWAIPEQVGDVQTRIPITVIKIGARYYAEGGCRVVKTTEDVVECTRVPEGCRPTQEDTASRTGPSSLTQEERLALYRREGFMSDGSRHEVSSTAKPPPEYVNLQILTEIR